MLEAAKHKQKQREIDKKRAFSIGHSEMLVQIVSSKRREGWCLVFIYCKA